MSQLTYYYERCSTGCTGGCTAAGCNSGGCTAGWYLDNANICQSCSNGFEQGASCDACSLQTGCTQTKPSNYLYEGVRAAYGRACFPQSLNNCRLCRTSCGVLAPCLPVRFRTWQTVLTAAHYNIHHRSRARALWTSAPCVRHAQQLAAALHWTPRRRTISSDPCRPSLSRASAGARQCRAAAALLPLSS